MFKQIIAEVLTAIFASGVIAVIFLDWLDWRSRLRDWGVQGISAFLSPDMVWSSGWLCYMLVATFLYERHALDLRTGESRSTSYIVVLLVFSSSIAVSILWARFAPGPKAQFLSRGVLRDRIRRMAQSAGIKTTGQYTWGVDQFRVCVLPEGYKRWFFLVPRRDPITVALPLKFLESFSRSEVDAIAARQLVGSQRKYQIPLFIAVSVYATVAVLAFRALKPAPAEILYVLICLLAIEIAALGLYWPVQELRYDAKAIRITGDPESYISALGRLSRLNDGRIKGRLRKLVKKLGMPDDRFRQLLVTEPPRSEDRYPTTGDYFVTGL